MAGVGNMTEKPPEVWQAEKEKLEAQVVAARAAAKRIEAQARQEEAVARTAEIELEKTEYERRVELTKDEYNHVYEFKEQVGSSSVEKCIRQLKTWVRLEESEKKKKPIEIIFFSPGGSVFDGLSLFDTIQEVRAKGYHVTVSTIGYAASMAGILLQAGDQRVMGKEAYILIHELAGLCSGKIGDVEDTVEFWKKVMDRVINIFYERSQEALKNNPDVVTKPLTKRQIAHRCERKDWWIDSDTALAHGFVDEVR